MARYGKEHKEATRRRIVETAGVRLKQDGIDGAGVAVLMKDAGLTNGAFYAHFESKQDLVAEVVATELSEQREHLALLAAGRAGVEQLVREYLSTAHVDNPGLGCPSAALLDEIARSGDDVRGAYSRGVMAIVDDIAERLEQPGTGRRAPGSVHQGDAEQVPPDTAVRAKVTSAYALMIGTIQLARALTDESASQEVLQMGLANTLAMLEV